MPRMKKQSGVVKASLMTKKRQEKTPDEHRAGLDTNARRFNATCKNNQPGSGTPKAEPLISECTLDSIRPIKEEIIKCENNTQDIIETEKVFIKIEDTYFESDENSNSQAGFDNDIKTEYPKVETNEETVDGVNIKSEVGAKFECPHCRIEIKHQGGLKEHLLTHTSNGEYHVYKCFECDFLTSSKNNLEKHVLHHESLKYKCDKCDFSDSSKDELDEHIALHHNGVIKYKCEKCDFQTEHKRSMKPHQLTHKSEGEIRMFTCTKCDFQSKYRYSLTKHLILHKSPDEVEFHKCRECNFVTKWRENLMNHMIIHKSMEEIKTYACPECSFRTKHKRCMNRHKLIHKPAVDVEIYTCSKCNYETKWKANLKKHKRNHVKS